MSHPLGAGVGGPAGAHPLNDDEHRRRGGWWWWLIALLALLLVALVIVLLVRHFNDNDTNTAAKKIAPTVSASAPSHAPETAAAPAPTSPVRTSPAPSATTGSGPAVPAAAACIRPSLTATPATVHAGQRITVVGQHFSGCHAVTGNAVPAATLPVSIHVTGSSAVAKALATARTSSIGDFTVTLTLPASTGKSVTLVAASRDVKTTRAYAGAATITYTSNAVVGGGRPTAVPAGTGGAAGSTSNADVETQLALLAGGLLIAAGGTTALLRRRRTAG